MDSRFPEFTFLNHPRFQGSSPNEVCSTSEMNRYIYDLELEIQTQDKQLCEICIEYKKLKDTVYSLNKKIVSLKRSVKTYNRYLLFSIIGFH